MSKILIIRACAIGDFVLNLPALRALSQVHENTPFVLVGYPSILGLAREFLPVEATHSIESQPWSRLFHEPIPYLDFDSAVVWMRDPSVADNLRLSGIPEVLRADPFPTQGHAATHLLRTLNLSAPPLPDLWKRESGEIIIHPGSGSVRKNWPYFGELVSRLGNRALALWERAPEGPVRVTDMRYTCGPHPALSERVLAGLTLSQVVQQLRRCRAYIGNDSGITHLAAYLGCPTIALFGPTDPRTWGPFGRRSRIIWKTNLEDISVDEVLLPLP
jgi:heptosyltransferase-3